MLILLVLSNSLYSQKLDTNFVPNNKTRIDLEVNSFMSDSFRLEKYDTVFVNSRIKRKKFKFLDNKKLIVTKNPPINGVYVVHHKSKLTKITEYADGLANGKRVKIKNGKIFEYNNFSNGIANGIQWITYKGKYMLPSITYGYGTFHGYFYSYYKNGNVMTMGYFNKGQSISSALFYRNGSLHREVLSKNGKFDGPMYLYDRKGNLIEEIFFENDRIIQSKKY